MKNITNANRYNFSDFTFKHYRQLLAMAKKNYAFRLYTNFHKGEPFIIWRHDVDFSIHSARNLARIEAKEGVKSTYFLLLHSEFYNLLEKENTNIVKDIIGLGHEIGIHFDWHYYNIKDGLSLSKSLLREKLIFEEIFEREVRTFSFHIPTKSILNFRKWKYAGLINTYAEYFQNQVGYCSDSNGFWRFRRLYDMLEEAKDKCLQVLIHPAWWQSEVMSPKQRISRCINGRAEKTKLWYKNILKETNRKNIDYD